jgi:hypothetical protein
MPLKRPLVRNLNNLHIILKKAVAQSNLSEQTYFLRFACTRKESQEVKESRA